MTDTPAPATPDSPDVSPQDPPADAPEVGPEPVAPDAPNTSTHHGDHVQDEATDEVGPFSRLNDDLAAGRITTDDAVRRLVAGYAAGEGGSEQDVRAAMYADEYDDDGNPHEAR